MAAFFRTRRRTSFVILVLLFVSSSLFLVILLNVIVNIALPGSYISDDLSIIEKFNVLQDDFERNLCPVVPPNLIGLRNVSKDPDDLKRVERELANTPGLSPGGTYRPVNCKSRNKVAIIVPYRDRSQQLPIFLRHIHPFLQRQQLAYTIFIIEQTQSSEINRGKLKNIGFMEALGREFFECFVFQDVDMLPENDKTFYSCTSRPRHLAASLDIWNYTLWYETYFGGVVQMPVSDFAKINGYSNLYVGWGGEDDDLLDRVLHNNLTISRYPEGPLRRYAVLPHKKHVPDPGRHRKLDLDVDMFKYDGLTDLRYRKVSLKLEPLFTHVLVDLHNNIENL